MFVTRKRYLQNVQSQIEINSQLREVNENLCKSLENQSESISLLRERLARLEGRIDSYIRADSLAPVDSSQVS